MVLRSAVRTLKWEFMSFFNASLVFKVPASFRQSSQSKTKQWANSTDQGEQSIYTFLMMYICLYRSGIHVIGKHECEQ